MSIRFLSAFFAVRFLRCAPAFPYWRVYCRLMPFAGLHDIWFTREELLFPENNPPLWQEGPGVGPYIRIAYRDIVRVRYEPGHVFILLRTGYYYRLARRDTGRIHAHLYWDGKEGVGRLAKWWYKL